jgi:transposase InsO family protein
MKYRFIDEHRSLWPVRLMCQVLQVSTGGYYSCRHRPASAKQQRREALTSEIQAIHQEIKERYGSPRIHAELQARGLDRQFEPTAANQVWVTDITYIPTGEGWLYLAAGEDLHSRQIVGWSMSERSASPKMIRTGRRA